MRRRNIFMEFARGTLRRMHQHTQDPQMRADIKDVIHDLDRASDVYETWIAEAKMIGYRNPSFDGDEIGYPEDDFDE